MKVLYTASRHRHRRRPQRPRPHLRRHRSTSTSPCRRRWAAPAAATNPEQLFAAGYAACFHSALRLVARRAKADVDGSEVDAPRSASARTAAAASASPVTLRGQPARRRPGEPPSSWSTRRTRSARTRTPPAATSTSTLVIA